eukprot:1138504-Pelagomonas_calceolata.AAC.1
MQGGLESGGHWQDGGSNTNALRTHKPMILQRCIFLQGLTLTTLSSSARQGGPRHFDRLVACRQTL